MIGGGQITEDIMKYAGADAYGKDAMDAVKFSRQWMGIK
jgi:5-methyltetrahydrofolate--homocysteine methyltransferase